MHNLNEDVEKVLRALVDLSNHAKSIGSKDVFFAANRAWWELDAVRARANQEKT